MDALHPLPHVVISIIKLDIKHITDAVPVLKQIVDTHNNRILDVIITDMKKLYYPTFVKPPLENDDDLQGQPSEHKVVILIPNSLNINLTTYPDKRRICTGPLPQPGIQEFGTTGLKLYWRMI